MRQTIFQVDAFSNQLFGGNPAAVVPLQTWLPDRVMQQIAMENNQAETAFFIPEKEGFHIRWFTPLAEVELCGHATLASAHILFTEMNLDASEIRFNSLSGVLTVKQSGNMLELNFPADEPKSVELPEPIRKAFLIAPQECYFGTTDYMLVYNSETEIRDLHPDFSEIKKVKGRGVIVTAPGKDCDFVSRFFAPAIGIDEDPVTGSAHTLLCPYWASKLMKLELNARQLSKRGGDLKCRLQNDRVLISGQAVTYMKGEISVPGF